MKAISGLAAGDSVYERDHEGGFVEDAGSKAAETVDRVIRERRTEKAISDTPLSVETDRKAVEAIVASAGWAPFHKVSAPEHQGGELGSIVPWRCHVLDAVAARELREWLLERGEAGPLPRLLAACSAMLLVTWLPNPSSGELVDSSGAPLLFEPTLDNMEHIAAASAAVQNMLLSAAARGYRTFWATARPLRTAECFDRLGISTREVLLGAIQLTAPDVPVAEWKHGSHRPRRGEMRDWMRWVIPEGRGSRDCIG